MQFPSKCSATRQIIFAPFQWLRLCCTTPSHSCWHNIYNLQHWAREWHFVQWNCRETFMACVKNKSSTNVVKCQSVFNFYTLVGSTSKFGVICSNQLLSRNKEQVDYFGNFSISTNVLRYLSILLISIFKFSLLYVTSISVNYELC